MERIRLRNWSGFSVTDYAFRRFALYCNGGRGSMKGRHSYFAETWFAINFAER